MKALPKQVYIRLEILIPLNNFHLNPFLLVRYNHTRPRLSDIKKTLSWRVVFRTSKIFYGFLMAFKIIKSWGDQSVLSRYTLTSKSPSRSVVRILGCSTCWYAEARRHVHVSINIEQLRRCSCINPNSSTRTIYH